MLGTQTQSAPLLLSVRKLRGDERVSTWNSAQCGAGELRGTDDLYLETSDRKYYFGSHGVSGAKSRGADRIDRR